MFVAQSGGSILILVLVDTSVWASFQVWDKYDFWKVTLLVQESHTTHVMDGKVVHTTLMFGSVKSHVEPIPGEQI